MKGLSLWEPWASLCALGAKKNETRGWATTYRGVLAIHAAKKMDRESLALCTERPFTDALEPIRFFPMPTMPAPRRPHIGYAFPFGCIVSVHRLVDCVPTEDVRASLTGDELAFGNYGDGRFAWKLELVHQLPKPLPFRGAQGLFEVPLVLRKGQWLLDPAALQEPEPAAPPTEPSTAQLDLFR